MSITETADIVPMAEDQTWAQLRVEAATAAAQEPILSSSLNVTILRHDSFADALSYRIAQKLSDTEVNAMLWREVCEAAFLAEPQILNSALADLLATFERDPACRSYLQPFLHFKGYQAVQSYRIGNWLWEQGRETLALHLQSRLSELYTVDIHPAAKIGHGLFLDHAHGLVVGETARIGNNVSILHGVTLGGTGKAEEDRHPKIGDGVLIGAGAKILGNIKAGNQSKIAAGSVVLSDIPPGCTVAGVPAKIVGDCPCNHPAETMEQGI
ncbi:MAG: serine O-acetyltransferase [bacterium]